MKTKINALDIYLISSEYKESLNSQNLNLKDEIKEKISFLERVSWKEIYIKWYDDENVKISEYENSKSFLLPIEILEIEEKTTENIEIWEEINNIWIDYIIENKKLILGVFIWVFASLFILNVNSHSKINVFEVKKEEIIQTWSIFETLTQRDLILQQKENFELQKQKDKREEKRKIIKQIDDEINISIESIKNIKKQREEIAKQKIELAQ